jgi:hypothetical protein
LFRITPNGWITGEEFKIVIEEKLLPSIKKKRESHISLKNKKALLLLDGHTSRYQRDLWETMKENNVDVLCLPSHTSNITQPLDLCVNANFKRALHTVQNFPKKHEMKDKLKSFVSSVCDKMYEALKPKIIRKG